MRAAYFIDDFRPNQKLPVVDFNATNEFDPKQFTEVGLQFTTEINPSIPEKRETITVDAIINIDVLRQIRATSGRIWALKYVRACTVSHDAPYGCSLLVAKNFVEAFCPPEDFADGDLRRERERQMLLHYPDLVDDLHDARTARNNALDKLERYKERFGALSEYKGTDWMGPRVEPDPRD